MQGSLPKSSLIVAALGAWTAGCGGSGHPATTGAQSSAPRTASTTPAPARAPAAPARPTKTQARDLGASINLRPADLPGFTATPHATTASDRRTNAQLARCSGTTRPSQAIADVHSDDFKSGSGLQSEQVTSEVEVVPSARLVARDLAAVRSGRARACVSARINALVFRSAGGVHVTLGGTHFEVLPVSAPGTDGSFGYRVSVVATVTASGRQVRIPFFVDFLGFAVGSSEVSLTDYRVGQPFPPATEQHAFSVLISRALGNRI